MSSYKRITKHPITGEWKMADWLDDFFGSHRYGVRFEGESVEETFRADDYEWETKDEMDSDTNHLEKIKVEFHENSIDIKEKILREIEVAKSAMHGGGNHRMVMEQLIEKIKKY